MTTAGSLPIQDNWINNRFGSKKGMLNYTLFETKRLIGQYSSLIVKPNLRPQRLVFVCVGNICRSPLAEAVATTLGYNAISYGLDTRGGDQADPRAISFGNSIYVDLVNHKTRKIDEYCAKDGDLLVCMEPKHLRILEKLGNRTPVTLLGLYGVKPCAYLHDPYNSRPSFFNHCESKVAAATKALIDHVT